MAFTLKLVAGAFEPDPPAAGCSVDLSDLCLNVVPRLDRHVPFFFFLTFPVWATCLTAREMEVVVCCNRSR